MVDPQQREFLAQLVLPDEDLKEHTGNAERVPVMRSAMSGGKSESPRRYWRKNS